MNKALQILIALGIFIAGVGVGFYFIFFLPQSKSQTEKRLASQELQDKIVECQKLAPSAAKILNDRLANDETLIEKVKYNEKDKKCYALVGSKKCYTESCIFREDVIDVYENKTIIYDFIGNDNNAQGLEGTKSFSEEVEKYFSN